MKDNDMTMLGNNETADPTGSNPCRTAKIPKEIGECGDYRVELDACVCCGLAYILQPDVGRC
jgi:hypothetical protein